ncbi:MAG: glycosyltransferase [Clostridia bacterium]|nr:glycosyltransferase [Clostridia bacterium]
MPFISVIIPTRNRRELLLRALSSVLEQTHEDLEIIVIDDASDDDTQAAVLEMHEDRVQYLRLNEQQGACAARNRGVDMARGEYIAFQDSDDIFHPDKLEKQLQYLHETGADVVVCAMNRITAPDAEGEVFPRFTADRPLEYRELLLENLCSTQCLLGKAEVFRAVRFDEQLPRLQDWDLMLRVVREYRVMLDARPLVDVHLQPDSLSRQPRKLLTALRRMFARYHADICQPDAPLVHGERVDVRWLRAIVDAAEMCGEEPWTQDVLDNAPDWVYRRGEAADYARTLIHVSVERRQHSLLPDTLVLHMNLHIFAPAPGVRFLPLPLLRDALRANPHGVSFDGNWAEEGHDPLPEAIRQLTARYDRRTVWNILSGAYGGAQVAAALAATDLMMMPEWARTLQGIELHQRNTPVKRIAVYYHSLRFGGVQQTAAALIRLWVQMGYEVTLITAQEATEKDYPIPDCVRRCVIPAFDPASGETRRQRVLELVRAAKSSDLLVYHAWADPEILFDLLAVRSMGVRFLVHTHSVFTMPLLEAGMFDRFLCLPDVYALADGVVTLSDVDRQYWKQVNARVYTTVNPLTYDPAATPVNALRGRTILWAGRISPEKRPMDAITVMQHVAHHVPDARLIMLGSGDDALMGTLRGSIIANGLADKVELVGFDPDTADYFRQADVLLCTSAYEGFSLTIAEAMTHGIPVVTYEMPYLTVLQGGGHICVPQGDPYAAGNAIIRLLTDAGLLQALGAEARRNAETRLNIDQAAMWKRILDDQFHSLPPMVLSTAQSTMLATLRQHISLMHRSPMPSPGATVYHTAFVPLPEKGPAKTLRKKAATFLQVLLIDGPKGVARVMKEKKKKRNKNIPTAPVTWTGRSPRPDAAGEPPEKE